MVFRKKIFSRNILTMYKASAIFAIICFILGFMFSEWSAWVVLDSKDMEVTKSMTLASSISYTASVFFMLMFLFGY